MFNRHNVDALIKGAHKMITQLEAAAEAHASTEAKYVAEALNSQSLAKASRAEFDRASSIATKLKDLFS